MAKETFKLSTGKWKILRGNYGCYASINVSVTKRVCEVQIPENINDKGSGRAPISEAKNNIKVLAASKDNFKALERIYKEAIKALEDDSNDKKVDFKLLVGKIADFANKKVKDTKKK